MIASSILKFAVAFLGFTTLASGSTLLYTRQLTYESSCTDPTSFRCSPTMCCIAEAYCQDNGECQTIAPDPSTVCPTDATLDQCVGYSHCCPAGQTCGEDATLNPLCDGLPAPGTSTTTPSEQEVCEADQYFWCTTYSLCCSGSAACSLDGDGNPQCGEGETVSPPIVSPPTQNSPTPNPPGGNNGSTTRSSTSRTSTSRPSTPTRSSSSSTTTATAAGSSNNAVKGANSMGFAGALGAAGIVAVLMA
ncbi:hypothetical protein M408DRAFT_10880 [Serendipita vermifera MAFF 305830]|uniref:Carbohydrate-binding module family 18 protein n=1 Tax=Serendipita vermifera MAFF 305830 TaxID=933852 RepID=A0A0C3AX63_SERVB|nr:hypothetical protein M408DRAFT_10880 [Serendipita vermifera MAFF 305830]